MPGMMYNYNPVFPASPLFCPPMAMVPFPMPQPVPPIIPEVRQRGGPPTNGTLTTDLKPSPPSGSPASKFQRPASQATSVKAEPGSAIGSVASGVNRVSSCFTIYYYLILLLFAHILLLGYVRMFA